MTKTAMDRNAAVVCEWCNGEGCVPCECAEDSGCECDLGMLLCPYCDDNAFDVRMDDDLTVKAVAA